MLTYQIHKTPKYLTVFSCGQKAGLTIILILPFREEFGYTYHISLRHIPLKMLIIHIYEV